jgi:pimeloyl-ACP methyl ester carboxylesterase
VSTTTPTPRLRVVAPGLPGATHTVIIVMPGGRANDRRPSRAGRLVNLRMIPLARAARKGARDRGVAVWRLRYRYRGWNEPARDPIIDARWALDQVRLRHPSAAVILVGHSMGGRTALWVSGDPNVVAVCALAPWVETEDPVTQVAGRTVLLAHGDRDRRTDPAGSRWFAAQAGRVTRDARFVVVRGDNHAMLWRWPRWNALVSDFVAGIMAARRAADRRRAATGPASPSSPGSFPARMVPPVSPSPAPPVSPPVAPSDPTVTVPRAPVPHVSYPLSTTLDLPPSAQPPKAPWTYPDPGKGMDARSNGHAHH